MGRNIKDIEILKTLFTVSVLVTADVGWYFINDQHFIFLILCLAISLRVAEDQWNQRTLIGKISRLILCLFGLVPLFVFFVTVARKLLGDPDFLIHNIYLNWLN